MVSFDTNVLVYATASLQAPKALRARDLIARAMRAGWTIIASNLAEFANMAIRKARLPLEDVINLRLHLRPPKLNDHHSGTHCCGVRRNRPVRGAC